MVLVGCSSTPDQTAGDPETTVSGPGDEVLSELGICGEKTVECREIMAPDGRSVRLAVVNPSSADATVFLGGGPGIDFTRFAAVVDLATSGKSLLVLGEPNSDQLVPGTCQNQLDEYASYVKNPDTSFTPDALVEACGDFIQDSMWTPGLIDEVARSITNDFEVDLVVAHSFGARTLQALASSPMWNPAGSDGPATYQLASPAPPDDGLNDISATRGRRLAETVCELAVCEFSSSSQFGELEPEIAAASYNLETNQVFVERALSAPDDADVISTGQLLVDSLLFQDSDSHTDSHMLRFLAIQCSAYKDWPTQDDSPFFDRLFSPCPLIAELGQMPRSTESSSAETRRVCVGVSTGDPVVDPAVISRWEVQFQGQGTNFSSYIFEDLPSGHTPAAVEKEMENDQSCAP